MSSKSKHFCLILLLLISSEVFSEGFIAGTLVKTKNGYVSIEQLKENDSIISYSFKNKELFESKIIKIQKKKYTKGIRLIIGDTEIITAEDHKFFCPLRKTKNGNWIQAKDLVKNDFILRGIKDLGRIDQILQIDSPNDFYCISIDQNRNFFVSSQDIFVHNFVWVLGIIGGFEVTLDCVGLVVGLATYCAGRVMSHQNAKEAGKIIGSLAGGNMLYKNFKDSRSNIYNNGNGSNNTNSNNDDDEDNKRGKKREKPSTKELESIANSLGYNRTREINDKGEVIFRSGNESISYDNTSHNDGFWKYFKRDIRKGTYNQDLTEKIGK